MTVGEEKKTTMSKNYTRQEFESLTEEQRIDIVTAITVEAVGIFEDVGVLTDGKGAVDMIFITGDDNVQNFTERNTTNG